MMGADNHTGGDERVIQAILAEDGVMAMKLGGVLLDQENLNLQVVSDGRGLLGRLNDAPNFFHAVIMNFDLPEIGGSECLTFIKRFHQRITVLVLSDSVEADRLDELEQLGVRKRHVMDRGKPVEEIVTWVGFYLGEMEG